VYEALAEEMKGSIHALALRTLAPAEAGSGGA
jgi:stress-induced morphogen